MAHLLCDCYKADLFILRVSPCYCCCLRRPPDYIYLGDKGSSAVRDGSEVVITLTRCCYSHTEKSGHSWCLTSSLSLSVGFTIQDEAVDVARSAPQGLTAIRTIFTFSLIWGLRRFIVIRVRPTLTRFPINVLYTPMDNTPLRAISMGTH